MFRKIWDVIIPKLTFGCDRAQLKVFSLFYKHTKNRIKSESLEAKNQNEESKQKFGYLLDKIKKQLRQLQFLKA